MADNVLFEIDASQIVAKLHLAGCQAAPKVNRDTDFWINSGIKNDDPNAKPDNPGKVSFDLKNPSNEYELGYATVIEYSKTYDIENTMNQLYDHLAKTAGYQSNIKDKIDSTEYKEFENRKTSLLQLLNSKNVKIDEKQLETVDGMKELKSTVIEEIGKKDKESYDKMMSELKKKVVECVDSYMKVFAGADNVEQIKESSFKIINLPEKTKDSNANGLIKDFEIQPATDYENEKQIEQFKANFIKNPTKDNCRQLICFVVKYTLNVDK